MPLKTLTEIFGGGWGIVAARRTEIEGGGAGTFDRVLKEELAHHFYTIEEAADFMECHTSTARKRLGWANGGDITYVALEGRVLYLKLEVIAYYKKLQDQAKTRAEKAKANAEEKQRRREARAARGRA